MRYTDKRHYHLALTDEERDKVATRLRLGPGAIVQDATTAELADRIERARGENDVLVLAGTALRAWYYGRVRSIAVEALEGMLDGTIDGTDGLDEWIRESCDGTDIVVYTFKAKAALLASDNEDAAEDMGLEAPSVEARAYCALEADVRELLEAYASTGSGPEGVEIPEGFEVGDAGTWRPGKPLAEFVAENREDAGLPEGYYSRGGKLALCIKVHRSATAAEVAEVAADIGDEAGGLAPLPGKPGRVAAWGLGWIEALATAEPERYGVLEGFARESGMEYAEERARELLGPGVRLWTDGRSGGWLVLEGTAPDADAAREAAELAGLAGDPGPGVDLAEHEDAWREARELIAGLAAFREHVEAVVRDFPRAVAWQACANGFVPAAEAHRAGVTREAAEARFQEALLALRDYAHGVGHSWPVSVLQVAGLLEVVAAFDAARAALEGGAE